MSKFTQLPVKSVNGGVQYLAKYPNNYGASIICNQYSYGGDRGLWELAVIKYIDNSDVWDIVYDTPIADDVLGYLNANEVDDILKRIEEL